MTGQKRRTKDEKEKKKKNNMNQWRLLFWLLIINDIGHSFKMRVETWCNALLNKI